MTLQQVLAVLPLINRHRTDTGNAPMNHAEYIRLVAPLEQVQPLLAQWEEYLAETVYRDAIAAEQEESEQDSSACAPEAVCDTCGAALSSTRYRLCDACYQQELSDEA